MVSRYLGTIESHRKSMFMVREINLITDAHRPSTQTPSLAFPGNRRKPLPMGMLEGTTMWKNHAITGKSANREALGMLIQ